MNSLPIKRILGGLGRLLPRSEPRRIVLLYHAVGEGPDACPLDRFAAQMAWLSEHTQVLSLDDLLASPIDDALQVAVTFDDGYASVARVAAPIMAQHNIPGSVYLTAASITDNEDDRRPSDPTLGHLAGEQFMLWSEVRALHDEGWQIGSHGLDHVDMTEQDDQALRYQLQGARALIEGRLGASCLAFAYPWGHNNLRTRLAVTAAGYNHAAGAIHGPLTMNWPALAFPRIDIRRDYTLADIENILRGDWDFLGPVQTWRLRRHAGE